MAVSTAYVNQILPKDATGVSIPGHVIQVVQTQTASQTIITSTSYANTTLAATITPLNVKNKILILMSPAFYAETTDAANAIELHANITRNNISIQEFRRAIIIRATAYSGIVGMGHQGSISYIDSPATTSQVTYTLQLSSSTVGQGARLNKDGGAYSTITLMEIAQ